jgi:TolB protein
LRVSAVNFFRVIVGMGVAACTSLGTCQDEVYMTVRTEDFELVTVTVKKFLSSDNTSMEETFRGIIVKDLRYTGLLRVMEETFLEQDVNSRSSSANKAGVQRGISSLVEGRLEYDGSSVVFVYHLYQLPERHLIFHNRLTALVSQIRYLAHTTSDEITYYLTGVNGNANTRIAFTRKIGRAKEIVMMDFDGEGYQPLTQNGTLNLIPSWSPDGKKLAFISYETGRPCLTIYSFKSQVSGRMLNVQGLQSTPSWSPDGSRIVLSLSTDGNIDLYLMNVVNGKLDRLTDHPAIETSPVWSPDGKIIAFTSDRSGSPQIYLFELDGRRNTRLTYHGNYNDSPAWSPKGDMLAFVTREETGFQIYTIDIDGNHLQRITDGHRSYVNPSWSPNGQQLAFASNREGEWDIYISNTNGSAMRKYTVFGDCECPRWSPRLNPE